MKDWPQDPTWPLKVYGNFKPEPDARPRWMRRREQREGNSNAYLDLIRQLWCTLGPERDNVQAHHLRRGPAAGTCGGRQGGLKSTDRWAVPLVWFRHEEIDNQLGSHYEAAYFLKRGGILVYDLAAGLWRNRGSYQAMASVLNHQQLLGTRRLLDPEQLDELRERQGISRATWERV